MADEGASHTTAVEKDIDDMLAGLRTNPTTSKQVIEELIEPAMGRLLQYLDTLEKKRGGKKVHWFCSKASPTVREVATFLLRLHAYESANTKGWMDMLWKVLHNCYDCERGHEEAKQRSRTTYLGAYPPKRLELFMGSIDRWELERLVAEYREAGFSPLMPSDGRELQSASTYMLYHALSNINLLKTPHSPQGSPDDEFSISTLIKKFPPRERIDAFPASPPPGVLLLLFHEDEKLRTWAQKQMLNTVLSAKDVEDIYLPVLQVIADRLDGKVDIEWSSTWSTFFSTSVPQLWSSLFTLLQAFSPEAAEALIQNKDLDFAHFLTRHLHDTDSHFPFALRCFIHILGEAGSSFWTFDSTEFPEVVYDSIKDNAAFERLLEADAQVKEPWFLTCFQVILRSVWDMPVFDTVLAKVINFMSEELQHPRFEPPCRALVMQVVLSTMGFVHQEAAEKGDGKRKEAISQVFAIQATNIAAVAFARQYRDSVWARARDEAVSLLRDIFRSDVSCLDDAAVQMCTLLQRAKKPESGQLQALMLDLNNIRHIALHPSIWEAVRKAVPMNDADGIAFLIHAVVPSLHLGLDPQHAFNEKDIFADNALRKTFRNAVERINAGLTSIRKDFSAMLSAFAEASNLDAIFLLLTKPEFVRDILHLIICPVEEVSLAAQDIVSQVSFAPERVEGFRFLLTSSPAASLDGISAYIDIFNVYATRFPEVCSMARWMVRCLADVVEASCDPYYGVFRKQDVVNNAELPKRVFKLWCVMCRASSLIFKHTPSWAVFYASTIMTDWMRDALIFVREMVDNLQVFESAMQGSTVQDSSGTSPIKLSNIGRKSVQNLDDVLRNLIGWLRLTDPETLHQSTELVGSLLKVYRRTGMTPPQEVVDTLEKYTSGAKSQGKLTREHLSDLSDAIAPFLDIDEEDDDEVEFVSQSHAKAPEPKRPEQQSRPGASSSKQMDIFKKIQPPTVKGFKQGTDRPESSRPPMMSAATIRERSAPKRPMIRTAGPSKPTSLMGQLRQGFNKERHGIPITHSKKMGPKNEGGRPLKVTGESESSAEDSAKEDGSTDGEDDLQYLSNLQRSPAKFKPTVAKPPARPERRQLQVIEAPNTLYDPVKERQKQREEQARRKMRLKPDLGYFTRQVLLWNYEADGEAPPYPPERRPILQQLPRTFNNYDDYRRAFEPLLMYECWQNVVKSKEEPAQPAVLCDIGSRSNTDDWLDLDVGINTDNVPSNWFLMDTDVVLLRQHPGNKSIMAKVESFRRSARGVEARFRCCLGSDARGLNPILQIRSQWKAHKVFSLTTIYREYAALHSLPYYDLFHDIMNPKPAPLPKFSDPEIQHAMRSFDVNEPQASAILGALQTDGFALIQGPPGTGKTKTICGLVGNWISKRSTAVRSGRPAEKTVKPKILVCAPSNAAIDEVARRLKEGVRTLSGQRVVLSVVRIGTDSVINVSVKDVSLDELIDRRINADPSLKSDKSEAQSNINAIRQEIGGIQVEVQNKQKELQETRDNAARVATLDAEIRTLHQKRTGLNAKLNQMRDKQKDAGRTMDAARRRFRQEVLDDADVICCTLSGSGHEVLSHYDFETVIIDEAAQSVEVSSLIPLKYQCRRCILVGDPEQLPPTVLSQIAEQYGYSRSLFVRIMESRPDAVHLLSIQYRMHPEISALDSAMFYNSKLKDGPGMAEKTAQPWHADALFGPYRFFDVAEGKESKARAGHSLVNDIEAGMILALYDRIRAEFSAVNFDYRIGIVTMYREQMFKLRRVFRDRHGERALTAIDFNTVDGFQGQEKDIIILSCVRAGANLSSVGFLADRRRTNVAITRARSSLFIFGHAATLERSDAVWKNIVQNARDRGVLMKADFSTFRSRTTVPTVGTSRKSSTPRKAKAETATPAMPELKTPQEIARAKQAGGAKANGPPGHTSSSSTKVPNGDAKSEGSQSSSLPSKRKSTEDGPKRSPPLLRDTQHGKKVDTESQPLSAAPDSRKENAEPSGSSVPSGTSALKRKTSQEGPKRQPPALRHTGNNQKNDSWPASNQSSRSHPIPIPAGPSPAPSLGNPISIPGRPFPSPALGNPIRVPSNAPPIRPAFGPPRGARNDQRPIPGGSFAPPNQLHRLPPRGDGATSQTMFIPKKRPNTNQPHSAPTNAKQRLLNEAKKQQG